MATGDYLLYTYSFGKKRNFFFPGNYVGVNDEACSSGKKKKK